MIPSTMRALTFHGPAPDSSQTGVMVTAVPEPGPEEILIRVTHAGVNFKDVMMRRGDSGYVPGWPVIPGLEVAGVIEGLGSEVDTFAIGMRVAALTNSGGLAEYVVAGQALTACIPDRVSSKVAAVVPGVWATAWLLLHEAARVREGDIILVHSASGAVGTAIATLAHAIPKIVLIGVVGAPNRVAAAERAGYQHPLVRDEHLADAVHTRLRGAGVNVVLDPQGTEWLDTDLRMLAPTGRIVLFGNATGAALDPITTGRLYAGNAAVGGFSIAALSTTAPARVNDAIGAVLHEIAEGRVNPDVSVSVGLDQAAALQQQLATSAAHTKHVINVNP